MILTIEELCQFSVRRSDTPEISEVVRPHWFYANEESMATVEALSSTKQWAGSYRWSKIVDLLIQKKED